MKATQVLLAPIISFFLLFNIAGEKKGVEDERFRDSLRSEDIKRWNDYKENFSNYGYSREKVGEINEVEEAWATDLGENSGMSHGAIYNGIFYSGSLDHETEKKCSGKIFGNFYAIDIYSGKVVWEMGGCKGNIGKASNVVSPVYGLVGNESRVFFADKGMNDMNVARINSIKAESGEDVWTRSDLGDDIYSSPLVEDGVVYVAMTDGIYALDAKNGDMVWFYPINYFRGDRKILYSNGFLYYQYFSKRDEKAYVIKLTAGRNVLIERAKWKIEVGSFSILLTPQLFKGNLYLANDKSLAAFDVEGANILWKRQLKDASYFSTALEIDRGNKQALIGQSKDGDRKMSYVSAYKLKEGKLAWQQELGAKSRQRAKPLAVGNYVFVANSYGDMVAYDLKSGDKVWEDEFSNAESIVDPIYSNGMLIGVDSHAEVKGWKLETRN